MGDNAIRENGYSDSQLRLCGEDDGMLRKETDLNNKQVRRDDGKSRGGRKKDCGRE